MLPVGIYNTISINIRSDRQMNNDRIEGVAKQATGTVKEAAGKILGDAKLESDGKAEKIEGKIQNAVGGITDVLRKSSGHRICLGHHSFRLRQFTNAHVPPGGTNKRRYVR